MTILRTPLEVAQRLRCSRRTLDEHVRSGALRYINIGHGKKRQRKMFTDADVDDFIERQTRRETPPAPLSPKRRHGMPASAYDVVRFSDALAKGKKRP